MTERPADFGRDRRIGYSLAILMSSAVQTAPAVAERRPFLRWAGSKRKQLPQLRAFWSDSYSRYVEPFMGSACLFFDIAPQAALLADTNGALIETYRVVRDRPEDLYERLCVIPRDRDTYNRWRSIAPRTLDRETRALRFLYLNRNCFNGIYRENTEGQFNVPMGRRPGEYFSLDALLTCSELLKRATLLHADFEKTVTRVQQGDFVYMDPPFAVSSHRVFRQYNRKPFNGTDIPRLTNCLLSITKAGADFLVSYADCQEAMGLSKQWNSVRLPVRRHVAGFAGKRRTAYEWLISNKAIPDALITAAEQKQ